MTATVEKWCSNGEYGSCQIWQMLKLMPNLTQALAAAICANSAKTNHFPPFLQAKQKNFCKTKIFAEPNTKTSVFGMTGWTTALNTPVSVFGSAKMASDHWSTIAIILPFSTIHCQIVAMAMLL